MKRHQNKITKPISRIKSSKNDLAPISFYFDLVQFDFFNIPIIPIPIRIDKVINGDPLLIVIPDRKKINKILTQLDLELDLNQFISYGISNLIKYSKLKYKKITFRTLRNNIVSKWINKSINLKVTIPSLINDFTFIFIEFLKLYYILENKNLRFSQEEYITTLGKYCEIIIAYFQLRITSNKFIVFEKDNKKNVKIYKEKKGKYYPEIVNVDVFYQDNDKSKKMSFVPYLIYDDIIELFTYNKKKLLENPELAIDIKQVFKNLLKEKDKSVNKSHLNIKENNLKKNLL